MTPRLLQTSEAARYVGVRDTLFRQLAHVHGVRAVRWSKRKIVYDVRDLDAWIEKQKGVQR